MTEPRHIVPLVPVQPEPSNPTSPADGPRPPKRKSSPFVRVGIVTGTAALVLVGAVAAMGASPAPSGSTTTPNAPSASGDPNGWGMGPGHWGGMGGGRGMGAMDFGGPGHGFGAISIAAIDGSNLSLKTADGWTRTIAVTDTTTITKAGATIQVSDLAVGDEIRFAETEATDGTYSITKIVVVMPSLDGDVTAKTSDSITVTQRDGTAATIKVSGSTTYTVQGVTSATLADVAVGMHVRAEGTQNSDGSLDASTVMAGLGGPDGHDGHGFGPGGNDGDADGGATPSASPAP